tara:strand:- start:129 stop:437 length:309 start_codon:yes stop_codon:yes gene_type:complete
MIQFLLIIPVLGALKNYVKYKRVSVLLFLRTPFIYTFIYSYLRLLNYKNKIILTVVNERIFMFIYKIIYSLLTDSYHKNKLKYIKKYNILYNSRECLEDLTD